jgi:hypothetical protein
VGALVILVDGAAAGYLRRGERELLLFAPEAEPQRSRVTREVARMLRHLFARRGMLVADINGEAATAHAAARLFAEEGFVPTALGLQSRPVPGGTGIAAPGGGGDLMAEQDRKDEGSAPGTRPRAGEDDAGEHDRVRSSNDRDQRLERDGVESEHNRGYDEAVRGERRGDVDPDSATSDVDRDDTPAE